MFYAFYWYELPFNRCFLFVETYTLVGKKVSRFCKQTCALQNFYPLSTLLPTFYTPTSQRTKDVRKTKTM